jgi:hypothetical protein
MCLRGSELFRVNNLLRTTNLFPNSNLTGTIFRGIRSKIFHIWDDEWLGRGNRVEYRTPMMLIFNRKFNEISLDLSAFYCYIKIFEG